MDNWTWSGSWRHFASSIKTLQFWRDGAWAWKYHHWLTMNMLMIWVVHETCRHRVRPIFHEPTQQSMSQPKFMQDGQPICFRWGGIRNSQKLFTKQAPACWWCVTWSFFGAGNPPLVVITQTFGAEAVGSSKEIETGTPSVGELKTVWRNSRGLK